ncbi:MAG: HEAT repeat domain-containing protein [Aureliella sp.]
MLLILLCLISWGQSVDAQLQQTERTLQEWKLALSEGELSHRRQAAVALRECSVDLRRQLLSDFIEILRHEQDGQMRLAILDTVADMGDQAIDAIPALMFAMQKNFGAGQTEQRHQAFRAAFALSEIGPPAVEGLRNLLTEKSDSLRAEAAMALARIGPPAAAAMTDLLKLLGDESEQVRREASAALGNCGEFAIESLLAASASEKPIVRAAAIDALGRAGRPQGTDDRVAAAIRIGLRDQDPSVRCAAVRAIDTVLDDDRLPYELLLDSLQDEDSVVGLEAVNAMAHRPHMLRIAEASLAQLLFSLNENVAWQAAFLLHLRGPEGVTVLLHALTDERARVEHIARALALVGQPALEPLNAALADSNPRVRQAAAMALGQIRPLRQETIQKIADGLTDQDHAVQLAYLNAIRGLGVRARPIVPAIRALPPEPSAETRMLIIDILVAAAPRDDELVHDLIAGVQDEEPRVQQHAIDALRTAGSIGQPALPAIIEKLDSPDKLVRVAAAAFIVSHGRIAEPAVPHLLKMLEDTDTQWRIVVIETLGELGATAQPAQIKLSACVDDSAPEIRAAAIRALANLQLEPLALQPQFVHALQDAEAEVRAQAVSSIRRFGQRGHIFLPDLILLTAHESDLMSIERLLERLARSTTDPISIPRLSELLQHEHPKVRQLAIKFIGLAGNSTHALNLQLEAMQADPDQSVRTEAALAIEKLSN